MRIKDPLTEGEEPYNLVPLTDMVFNLLIFFLCATTFVQVEKELAVQLPKTRTDLARSPEQARELIINVKQDGSTVVAGKAYDAAGLESMLVDAVKRKGDTVVVIRADERGILKYFADVARTCKQAGVREAKLVYLDDPGGASK